MNIKYSFVQSLDQQLMLLSMTPPKNHAVGDPLIVVHLESIWFICCNFDGKLIKIIKEHMY